jgi:hypothetical protein
MYLELSAQTQSAEYGNQFSLFSVSLFLDAALAHNVKVITIVKNEYKGSGSRRLWINRNNVTALTSNLRQISKAVRQDTLMRWLCTIRIEIRSCNDTPSCPLF